MKNKTINLQEFTDSSFDSTTERDFLESALPVFMDKKLKDRYAKLLQEKYAVQRPTATKKTGGWSKWIFVALTIIIVGIIALLYLQPTEEKSVIGQQVASTTIQYEEIDLATRGEISTEIIIAEMAQFYLNKDTKAVIENYESLDKGVILDNVTLRYTALSYAIEGQYNNAERMLQSLLSREENSFSHHQESRWLLAKVLINNDKKQEAKNILTTIKKGQYKYEEAQNLIDNI